ncbi:NTF2 fold immunity protein [Flavobacterium rhizosphaerae]|uniref:NTF2 fold immunity protein n=1 Tax=Flavobacterium rhizosphaerae TaxID=3163298 RepID=A0ABW8Z0U4_9FLAO
MILPDSITAINIAEPILFRLYGRDNILKQKPYENYLINNYWIIMGTMPKDKMGGVFLIIIDARDCRVLRINTWEIGSSKTTGLIFLA